MSWNQKDLQNLKAKGLKIDDSKSGDIAIIKKATHKIAKVSIEKKYIELWLEMYKRNGFYEKFEKEHQFDIKRKFRFDYAIPSLKIAIEYEGIHSAKSGHTTVNGFNKDVIKYNLALVQGWRVLRYTSNTYKNFETDLLRLLNEVDPELNKDYCRLFQNGEIEKPCKRQCNNCVKATADDLLKQNFLI